MSATQNKSALHKYKYHLSAGIIAAIVLAVIASGAFAGYEIYHHYNIASNDGSSGMTADHTTFHDHVVYKFFHPGQTSPFATRAGDNTITVTGRTCLLMSAGGVNASTAIGNTTCPLGGPTQFASIARYIGLMNVTSGHSIILNGSDTMATSKAGGTRNNGHEGIIFTANQGAPARCAITYNAYNSVTCTTPTITIGAGQLSASGTNIAGGALLNGTSSTASMLFGEQAFSAVNLANGDSIIIAWTLTD